MKQVIREGTFETNSSSMHSLVITKRVRQYTKEELALNYDPKYEKEFQLWGYDEDDMYYGRWPFRVLNTPLEKLRYYSAYVLGSYKKRKKEDIDRIVNFVMKQTGITDPNKVFLFKRFNLIGQTGFKSKSYGDVSPNDTGEDPMDFVERKGIDWEDLILNPKYIIIVDGDEIQHFKPLIKSEVIDTDNFEDISSGVDFWNDVNQVICLTWYDFEEIIKNYDAEEIGRKTKTLDIKITNKEDLVKYRKFDNEILNAMTKAKNKNSNIKIRLIFEKNFLKKNNGIDLSGIDTSVFDDILEDED